MSVRILVPYRGDNGGRRDQLWAYTRKWLDQHLPYDIVLGPSPAGPFNRSAAVNAAAHSAGSWDVAIIHDADTVVPAHQIKAAVHAATTTGRLAFAFTSVVDLGKECTDRVLATNTLDLEHLTIDAIRTAPLATQSSALAVTRELWERVGGFDELFVGWSAEDNAFCRAATIMAGTPERIPGHAFHLWHPPGRPPGSDPNYIRNQKRWRQYQAARTPQHLSMLR